MSFTIFLKDIIFTLDADNLKDEHIIVSISSLQSGASDLKKVWLSIRIGYTYHHFYYFFKARYHTISCESRS
jgi:hypothetical protein